MQNPFAESVASDPEDRELVRQAQGGNREALEQLITRHQAWIYNIVLRMVYHPQDAEDATQEILVKLITKLSTFAARSSFRTWLYRIVVNHVLNMNRGRADLAGWTFTRFGNSLDATPDMDLPDPRSVPADVKLLVDEARIGCTSGLLLCLDREQRLIYILGDIFGVTDLVGAELLEISRENFRQKLARARRDLRNFVQDKCGLINETNPCRCAKKTQGFMNAGFVNPRNLLFAKEHVTRVRDVAARKSEGLDTLDAAYAELHRDHPFHEPADFVIALRTLIDGTDFKSTLELD
jgi:RNA polymerase sigma factor (sigma-70 family)